MKATAALRRIGFAFLPALAIVVALSGCNAAAVPSSSAAVDVTPSPAPSAMASASSSPRPTVAVVKVTPIPNSSDSKTVVKLVVAHVRWMPTTLAAPAGAVWHIEIDNQDGPPEHHNFVVASGKTVPERIFQSKNFDKGTVTLDVPALPAGNYLFICTVHPDVMTGTLELR
jgi:plastocyanin